MHYGHILGSQHFVDGPLLCRIQIGEAHVLERKGFCPLLRIEQVTKVA